MAVCIAVCTLAFAGLGVVAVSTSAAQANGQITDVNVTTDDPVTGDSVIVETTIANLESSDGSLDVTDVYLRTAPGAKTFVRVEEVGALDPGGSVTVPMSATFETAGEKDLTVNVVVKGEDGTIKTYESPLILDVEEPRVRAQLDADADDGQYGTTRLDVTNAGNVEFTDVRIAASANGTVIDRAYVFDLDPETNRTAVFDTRSVSNERVTFEADFRANDRSHTATHTIDLREREEVLGEMLLTSVETTRTATGVALEGDASNVGGTDAGSVLVEVPDTGGVRPVSPSGRYFVGDVEKGEFATFELTAETPPNASSVPVEISYIAENERVQTTQRIELAGTGGVTPAAESGSGGNAGGLPIVAIAVGLGAIAVLGTGVYVWRRR
ncbi:hypothetical protein [Natronomonas moolapensis]|uniref:hypothetical protein n=1 Tax=Natronomonas moolapensis TaxID=416273 RepID=UPI0018D3B9DF|nr:hypothetical protein [Natronomonas moolapensis]